MSIAMNTAMKASICQAVHRLPAPPTATYPQGTPFVSMLAEGDMRVEVFAPSTSRMGVDLQQPHSQDELYFVHRGTAQLVLNGQRLPAAAGDAFFVAANAEHRFENYSADFVTWVVFYGEHHLLAHKHAHSPEDADTDANINADAPTHDHTLTTTN
jgi:mannose-6-phosphate isomerase-like protein (cupin superfamily)